MANSGHGLEWTKMRCAHVDRERVWLRYRGQSACYLSYKHGHNVEAADQLSGCCSFLWPSCILNRLEVEICRAVYVIEGARERLSNAKVHVGTYLL
jgi:hypothetical protein